jgi:hypothetical protein
MIDVETTGSNDRMTEISIFQCFGPNYWQLQAGKIRKLLFHIITALTRLIITDLPTPTFAELLDIFLDGTTDAVFCC